MTGLDTKADVIVLGDGGSVFLVTALTSAGQEWLDTHIEPDAIKWCSGIACEHRFLADIINGMRSDGLEIA